MTTIALTSRSARTTALLLGVSIGLLAAPARAQQRPGAPPDLVAGPMASSEDGTLLQGVGFDQNLDAQLPLDLRFRDEAGTEAPLSAFFRGRPVILAMVYYRCPLLCSQVLNGLVRSLRPLSMEAGQDFDIVTVSIDPQDTPELAGRKKAAYLEEYGREGSGAGWHFLTGDEASVRRLASTIGFRYTYNPTTRLYAHAAGIVVVTPTGRVSRYLFGIDYPPRDLQFAVLESSEGKIGSPIRRVLLFCYDYDAATGTYTLSIMRLTQIFGILTVLTLAGTILMLLRWERRRRRDQLAAPEPAASESA